MALTDAFAQDPAKQIQWNAFVRKAELDIEANLNEIVGRIRDCSGPPLSSAATGASFEQTWTPPGPWK